MSLLVTIVPVLRVVPAAAAAGGVTVAKYSPVVAVAFTACASIAVAVVFVLVIFSSFIFQGTFRGTDPA